MTATRTTDVTSGSEHRTSPVARRTHPPPGRRREPRARPAAASPAREASEARSFGPHRQPCCKKYVPASTGRPARHGPSPTSALARSPSRSAGTAFRLEQRSKPISGGPGDASRHTCRSYSLRPPESRGGEEIQRRDDRRVRPHGRYAPRYPCVGVVGAISGASRRRRLCRIGRSRPCSLVGSRRRRRSYLAQGQEAHRLMLERNGITLRERKSDSFRHRVGTETA